MYRQRQHEHIFVRSSRQSYPVAVEMLFSLAKADHFHQGDQRKQKKAYMEAHRNMCISEASEGALSAK